MSTTNGKQRQLWPASMAMAIIIVEYGLIFGRLRKLHTISTVSSSSWEWEEPKRQQLVRQISLPRCPKPVNTSMWNHFDALVDENVDMSNKVGRLLASRNNSRAENATEEEIGGGVGKSNIPHLLVFTHKDNLFDCSYSASNTTSSANVHTLAENAKATVRAYHQVWPDLRYVFLSDDDCREALNLTEPELIPFFNDAKLEGAFTVHINHISVGGT